MECQHLFVVQFAADFAQRWIVNWLEKRSGNYKTKSSLYQQQPSSPTSNTHQDVRIEEPNASDNASETASSDKNGTTEKVVRKNSLTSQLQETGPTSEMTKTPSMKKRQQSQQEGLVSIFTPACIPIVLKNVYK